MQGFQWDARPGLLNLSGTLLLMILLYVCL